MFATLTFDDGTKRKSILKVPSIKVTHSPVEIVLSLTKIGVQSQNLNGKVVFLVTVYLYFTLSKPKPESAATLPETVTLSPTLYICSGMSKVISNVGRLYFSTLNVTEPFCSLIK